MMNSLITTYCTTVLVDLGSEVPHELMEQWGIQLDSSSFSALLKQLEELVETESLVLVTNSEDVVKDINLFKENLSEHYSCLMFNEKLDADLTLREYEGLEMQVMNREGRYYRLGREPAQPVYSTDDRRVVSRTRGSQVTLSEGLEDGVLKRNPAFFVGLLPDCY